MRPVERIFNWTLAAVLAIAVDGRAESRTVEREITATGLTDAEVEIKVGAAHLELRAHDGGPLARIAIEYSTEKEPQIDFDGSGSTGRLKIRNDAGDEISFSILGNRPDNPFDDHWMISLSRDLPLLLHVEFGLGPGEAEFGGLTLSKLEFVTGLSDVVLEFSSPCQGVLEHVGLATGLGSMEVHGLSNALIQRLEFAGGLGAAVLDFSGSYRSETEVELDVGMGSLQLMVPQGIGVKIRHGDSFLSNHEFERLEQISEDTWYSEDWQAGPGNLVFDLSVGMGSVELDWIEPK